MAVPALIEPGNSSNLMATVRAWKRMVAAGFTLSVRDDRLIVAPADRLTDSQRNLSQVAQNHLGRTATQR